jgi:nucleotide-binding universal stress UspA family protein
MPQAAGTGQRSGQAATIAPELDAQSVQRAFRGAHTLRVVRMAPTPFGAGTRHESCSACLEATVMPKGNKPYIILVAIDYAETGQLALERAFELALERPNSELHVLHVLPLNVPVLMPELGVPKDALPTLEEASEELARYIETKVHAFRAQRSVKERAIRVVSHLRLDMPALEIARVAAELEADLVVVGTHGRRSLARFVRGSVAEVAVRLCPCPVLVVRPRTPSARTFKRPCARCLETREATERGELFCEQHRERHDRSQTAPGSRPTERRASSRRSPSPRLG